MKSGHIYFEIQADDPKRAIDFYSKVFGWTFSEVNGLPVPYWRIETGGSRGGLLKRPAKTPPMECGTNAFVCSLEIENFDSTAKNHSGAWRNCRVTQICRARYVLARLLH